MTASEKNYKQAKQLYKKLSDDFYNIENNSSIDNKNYIINQTIQLAKKLNSISNRINLDELEKLYDKKIVDILERNINVFKEGAYYIKKTLNTILLFDKIKPALKKYIKNVDWHLIANSEEEAQRKIATFLTNENNLKLYKNQTEAIIRGTLSKKMFLSIYNNIISLLPKKKKHKSTQRSPLPPDMWPEKNKKQYYNRIKKQNEKNLKKSKDKNNDTIEWNENFISLSEYNKLID